MRPCLTYMLPRLASISGPNCENALCSSPSPMAKGIIPTKSLCLEGQRREMSDAGTS